jgi:S1-C subfamily serine protease
MTAALLLLALSITTDDSVPDSKYVRYGQGFAAYTKPIVVLMEDGRTAHSSAVVIDDHWCLTAAHVVERAVTAAVADNPVESIFIHTDYESNGFGWFDIAVLRCRDDFALRYYPPLSDGEEEIGDVVSVAGYGVTGRLSTGYDKADWLLRAGTARIVRFERTVIVCSAQRGGTPMAACIAPGDSGGPMFVGAGPKARLAGLASFTMRDKGPLRSREGEEQGATRIAFFRQWIDECRRCR